MNTLIPRHFTLSFLFLFIFQTVQSQTTLSLGDIAFTGYNSDTPDGFSFVLLKDIEANTTISFTEKGWLKDGGFISNTEGTFVLTFANAYECGDEIYLQNQGGWAAFDAEEASAGSLVSSGSFSLSASGDQIFAYQGAVPTAGNEDNFLAAIQMNGDWDDDATNTNTSAQADIFANNPGNDLAISPEADNAKYDCSTVIGVAVDLREAINDVANWTTNSSSTFDLSDFCSFFCGASCTLPDVPSLSANSTTVCPNEMVTLTISGNLNDADQWTLFTESCEGMEVMTTSGNSFSFFPTETTTYFVAGTGGCVTMPDCTNITITVNGVQATAGTDQKVPQGTTLTMLEANAALSGGNGSWSLVNTGDGNGIITNTNDPNSFFSGTAGWSYGLRWTLNNPGCPTTFDDVTITFLDPTPLNLGDLAFLALQTDNPDKFSFAITTEINAGTEISFTDNGWLASGGFRSGESIFTLSFCNYYPCASEFVYDGDTFQVFDSNGKPAGEISGNALILSASGDQIFAWQGTEPTSTNLSGFLAAINAEPWSDGATSSNDSGLPSVFQDGVTSISFDPEIDNAHFTCNNTGQNVRNVSNWLTSNSSFFSLPLGCEFTCCDFDNELPQPVCLHPNLTLDPINGTIILQANDVLDFVNSSDNCGMVNFVNASPAQLNCEDLNTSNSITVTVDDGHGNTNTCTSTITVEDDTKPVFIHCPSYPSPFSTDINDCLSSIYFTTPTVDDNCGVTELKAKIFALPSNQVVQNWTTNPNGQFPVGEYKIRWRAKDASGNKKVCNQNFSVVDDEFPIAKCVTGLSLQLVNGQATITPQEIDAGSSDNCNFDLTLSQTTFSCADLGEISLTLTATDDAGNSHACHVPTSINGTTISIENVTKLEGSSGAFTFFLFPISRAENHCSFTLPYTTQEGSATISDNDFQDISGALYFPAGGSFTQYAIVRVVRDTKYEMDENFFVHLTAPSGIQIGNWQGEGLILNDDIAPLINDFYENEKNPQTALQTFSDEKIWIFPNPVQDNLFVQTPELWLGNEAIKIQISDAMGRLIESKKIIANEVVWDVSALPQGMYILSFMMENGTVLTERFVKK